MLCGHAASMLPLSRSIDRSPTARLRAGEAGSSSRMGGKPTTSYIPDAMPIPAASSPDRISRLMRSLSPRMSRVAQRSSSPDESFTETYNISTKEGNLEPGAVRRKPNSSSQSGIGVWCSHDILDTNIPLSGTFPARRAGGFSPKESSSQDIILSVDYKVFAR